jgi:circadian clock protein KaiC
VLTGSMRLAQEARETAESVARQRETEQRARERERKQKMIEAQIAALQHELATCADEGAIETALEAARMQQLADDRRRMSASRQADAKQNARGNTSSGKGRTS